MTSRSEVEWLLAGLEKELEDGLHRLERRDGASDHVAVYRDWFDRYAKQLRHILDWRPPPETFEAVACALQAAWLAATWERVSRQRDRERGPDNLNLVERNENRRKTAAERQARCKTIAQETHDSRPSAVMERYRQKYPKERPPKERTIRRYLNSAKK